MSSSSEPLVEIITPVYNGAAYLTECIESVLRQTYGNWIFTIADNVSTDETVAIAQRYANVDPRIRVRTHTEFLPQIPNWNRAVEYLDPRARYLKVLHADDWLYPECLAEMVAVAERHPSVGIVSSFRLEEDRPSLGGLPSGQEVTPGLEVCKGGFAAKVFVFGSPSNLLVRADLVRKHAPFYDPYYQHADYEVCFRLLQESELGFVFKVLTYTRRHNESYTSRHLLFNTYPSEDLAILRRYGPSCFSREEFERIMSHRIAAHYRFLGRMLLEGKSKEFWAYQRNALDRAGAPLNYWRLAYGLLLALLNVHETARSLRRRIRKRAEA